MTCPLSLESQIAQRLMLGYEGSEKDCSLGEALEGFLQQGLGGVIFFRHNFEALAEPAAVGHLLTAMARKIPDTLPVPFLAIDQEGGLVERLPHQIFPASVSPRAVALALKDTDSDEFCAEVYDLTAFYLAMLGFNMNLAPVLDVNLSPANPVIGVRAFGETPEAVWRFSRIVLERLAARKLLAVGKHFPGHGNGTVDSHCALPTLQFTDRELEPFRQAIAQGIPALMVAHGYYPDLQEAAGEAGVAASASRSVIQGLLREKLGFSGLVISDDLCMGAVSPSDPVETAINTLAAGADMLIYRESGEIQQAVFQGIRDALNSGRLDRKSHEESVARILAVKNTLPPVAPNPATIARIMTPDAIAAVSDFIASRALTVLSDRETVPPPPLSLNAEDLFWLIHPDRARIPQYQADAATSPDLADLLADAGLIPLVNGRYSPGEPIAFPEGGDPPEIIVFVSYNPRLFPEQGAFCRRAKAAFPQARLVVVSAGLAEADHPLPEMDPSSVDLHLALCSYRPPTLKALAQRLVEVPGS